MSAQELDVLTSMLRSGGLDLSAPPAQAREAFDAMFAGVPIGEGVVFEATTLGGVPARWAIPAGASKERVLLYLHGGGYVIGSTLAYRALTSNFARACGARGVAIDYRLAPENP